MNNENDIYWKIQSANEEMFPATTLSSLTPFDPMSHARLSPGAFDPSGFSSNFILPRFASGGPTGAYAFGPAIVEPELSVIPVDEEIAKKLTLHSAVSEPLPNPPTPTLPAFPDRYRPTLPSTLLAAPVRLRPFPPPRMTLPLEIPFTRLTDPRSSLSPPPPTPSSPRLPSLRLPSSLPVPASWTTSTIPRR